DVGPVRDRDGERTERQLPVRALLTEVLGDGDRAPQAGVKAGRAGEEGAVLGVVAPPRDLARLGLVVERVVDGALDDGPEVLEEAPVARRQIVVPRAVGDVARDVGVEGRVLHVVADVVRVPRAVGALPGAEPLVAPLSLGVAAAHVERHRRLHQVPRIGVVPRDPGDVTVRQLHGGDRVHRRHQLVSGHDPFDGGQRVHRSFSVYTTRLLPSGGLSARSRTWAQRGRLVNSHTRKSWYLRTGSASALSTPIAHLSIQYGEWSACAWCDPRNTNPARWSFASSSGWR